MCTCARGCFVCVCVCARYVLCNRLLEFLSSSSYRLLILQPLRPAIYNKAFACYIPILQRLHDGKYRIVWEGKFLLFSLAATVYVVGARRVSVNVGVEKESFERIFEMYLRLPSDEDSVWQKCIG